MPDPRQPLLALLQGANVQAYRLTKSTFALSYQFTWRVPGEHAAHEEVA